MIWKAIPSDPISAPREIANHRRALHLENITAFLKQLRVSIKEQIFILQQGTIKLYGLRQFFCSGI